MTCSPWVSSADAVAPCNTYDIDTTLLDRTMQMASDILFALTRRRYPGICTDVVRPLAQWRPFDGPARWWPDGTFGSARWGWCSCNRSEQHGCSTIPEVELPGRPVRAGTVSVLVDGEEFTDFRLDDGHRLVRTDGDGWPCCQDLLVEDDQPGSWSVTYNYGRPVPEGGLLAAAVLGCQLYLAIPDAPGVGSEQSQLPKRITSISRQNITLAVIDPLTLFKDGLTGIPIVDLWVQTDNASATRRPAGVLVPGKGRTVRRTG